MDERRPPWTFDRIYKQSAKLDPDNKGIGPGTVKNLIAGIEPTRMERVYLLCDLFGWKRESVESIRAGGEPEWVVRPSSRLSLDGDVIAEMDSLATAIEDAASSIRRMLSQVDQSNS
jgi:hypothetical protein